MGVMNTAASKARAYFQKVKQRRGATPVAAFGGVAPDTPAPSERNWSFGSNERRSLEERIRKIDETQLTMEDGCASEVSEKSSLAFSSEDSEEQGCAPPLPPDTTGLRTGRSALDGAWELCSPKASTGVWLHTLRIDGDVVVDGTGRLCRLARGRDGRRYLCGGALRRQGAALVRRGKSGAVQVYMPCFG